MEQKKLKRKDKDNARKIWLAWKKNIISRRHAGKSHFVKLKMRLIGSLAMPLLFPNQWKGSWALP